MLSSYEYTLDKVGNRTQVVDTSGTETYGYDDLYRLEAVTYPNGDTQSYTYDPVGNRLTKVHNGLTTSYSYDAADELTRACANAASCPGTTAGTHYGFEGNGAVHYFGPNANSSNLNDVKTAATAANQFPLIDYEGRHLRVGHCYDVDFDGAVAGTDQFAILGAFGGSETTNPGLYDPRKDLEGNGGPGPNGAIAGPDFFRFLGQFGQTCPDMAHYFYNGDGLRVHAKTGVSGTNFAATDYLWDVGAGLPVILQETTNAQTKYYVHGLDLISSVSGSTPTYYLYDGLGSTTGLANTSGQLTDTYKYDVFGAERSHTGTSTQPFKFTGEQNDASVNGSLYYLRARAYDPSLGRFWSRDPLPFMQRYAYVRNNPATLVDPSGLGTWEDFKEAAGGALNCATNPEECAHKALTGADRALSYVPGWDPAVGATHDFLYGPYRAGGDALLLKAAPVLLSDCGQFTLQSLSLATYVRHPVFQAIGWTAILLQVTAGNAIAAYEGDWFEAALNTAGAGGNVAQRINPASTKIFAGTLGVDVVATGVSLDECVRSLA